MNLTPRQLIFAGVLVAVPAAAFFALYRPMDKDLKAAKASIELKRTALEALRAQTAQTPNLQKENEAMQAKIAEVEGQLPSSKELDAVLRDVARIATKEGLRVPKFSKNEQQRPAGTAQEQPLDLEIVGDFDSYYSFLLALEKLPRITRLTDMQLQRLEDKDGHMRCTFKLSIYYQTGGSNAGLADAGSSKGAAQ